MIFAASRLAVAAAMLVSAPGAIAQHIIRDVFVGEWRISQAIPGVCQALTWVEAYQAKLTLFSVRNGDFKVVLEDEQWQVVTGETYAGSISWDGWATSEDLHWEASQLPTSGLLVSESRPQMLEKLRETRRLWVRVPGVGLDREYPITGADALFEAYDKCRDSL